MTLKDLGDNVKAIAVLLSIFIALGTWVGKAHNQLLMDTVAPLLRASYVTRITNYRAMKCDGPVSATIEESLQDVLQDYEDLVGRPISSGGGC